MGETKFSGPGKAKSVKELKKSLKKAGGASVRSIPSEDSLTVRFLEEPEDWHGYYEHWIDNKPVPCVEGDCEGCNSDDPEEKRRSFRYLANAFIVDDQQVRPVKLPKSLVDMLVDYGINNGTIMDRDYDLFKTGSGKTGTSYKAQPDAPHRMKMDRFLKKKFDHLDVLNSMLGNESDDDDDEDDEPVVKKKKGTKNKTKVKNDNPWDDDDDDDERPVRKKKSSTKKPVKKSVGVKKKSVKKSKK